METALTVSKQAQPLPSMRYEDLRLKGLKLAQALAGKIWTDYNVHDPGVTILEVLSYVMTELGYRSNFDIRDILTEDLKNPSSFDLKNFYTACEILPNCPVTFNDYRKVIIDTEVFDPDEEGCQHAGVRNAWISKSDDPPAELPVYIDRKESTLSLDPIPGVPQQELFYVRVLYDVLVELNACDKFGDLNANTVEGTLTIETFPPDTKFEEAEVEVEVFFPRWDDGEVDWSDPASIRSRVTDIKLEFSGLPDNYVLKPELQADNTLALEGIKDEAGSADPLAGMQELADLLNAFIYHPSDGLIAVYMAKMEKVGEVIDAVRDRLHANRNLCEDWFKFKAVRVEDILLCADIALTAEADVEEITAEIYFRIGNFLSPEVKFRTLIEMQELCKAFPRFVIEESSNVYHWAAIKKPIHVDINPEDTLTILKDEEIVGTYTVECVRKSEEVPDLTEIVVEEELELDEDVEYVLLAGDIEEESCLTVDEIFEGPKLKHGFIDTEELEAADLRTHIHVSDLIRIIMDIEGVLAVRSIQIANRPQDANPAASSKSVKWCLELNVDKCYVPRLHIDDSRLIFYKDQLPFIAKSDEVEQLLDEKSASERPQKIYYPELDIPVPAGTFKQLDAYTSIQEEFPQVFGIGSDGIPEIFEPKSNVTAYLEQKAKRKAEVMQLKGYLMPFDQLLANFLSQLHHVKYLFSMNGEKDPFGNYLIDRTYFVQSLVDVVPNGNDLYKDPLGHLIQLEALTEDEDLYVHRRNKFLDHLLARFSESFANYALLAYSVNGAKAPLDLIEDKLQFLNRYPELSSGRGKAFNYKSPCHLWHIHNISGLELRGSLLLGIDEPKADDLAFGSQFEITINGVQFGFRILDSTNTPVLESPILFDTENEAKSALEEAILHGAIADRFQIKENADASGHMITLQCADSILSLSIDTALSIANAESLAAEMRDLFLAEFLNNPLSNRKNLSCTIDQYIVINTPVADMSADPNVPHAYLVEYEIYDVPLVFTPDHLIFSGTMRIPVKDAVTAADVLQIAGDNVHEDFWSLLWHASEIGNYIFDPAEPVDSDQYRFALCDRYGEIAGRSTAFNFNDAVADEIGTIHPEEITIVGEDDSEEILLWESVSALGANVFVGVSEPPVVPNPVTFKFTREVEVIDTDFEARRILLNSDLTDFLSSGDSILLLREDGNSDPLTIFAISSDSGETTIIYRENLPEITGTFHLQYTKAFPVADVSGQDLTLSGGADLEALEDFVAFINKAFFGKEGMHLIEHTLLRPKCHTHAMASLPANSLDETLADFGNINFETKIPVLSVDHDNESMRVSGDFTAEIQAGVRVQLNAGSVNKGQYTVSAIALDGGDTIVEIEENLLFPEPDPDFPDSNLIYTTQTSINSVNSAQSRITLTHPEAANLTSGSEIRISGSSGAVNDGKYQASVFSSNGSVELALSTKEQLVSDALLPIHLESDCESCRLTDPYSCVATIVLPYWAGRFINIDLRKFVEKTLREEAPAHILLNICWVDCDHMFAFETAYKKWLIACNRAGQNKAEISSALGDLIDIIGKLRTVYPEGTLHSCDDEDISENAIILSKSALGTL